MDSQRGSRALPPRPLTLGELLDAAVGLCRDNARALLPIGVALAAVEQAVLYALRRLTGVDQTTFLFHDPLGRAIYEDQLGAYWIMIAFGYLVEGVIIALLGGLTARAAAASLAGQRLSARALLSPRGTRFGSISLVAMIVGVVYGFASLSCWIPWIVAYGLLGLVIPAIVIDGKGPFGAIWRSLVLSSRDALRAGWIRLTGYLAWMAVRVALWYAGFALLLAVVPISELGLQIIAPGLWLCVNSVAYPTLACLDAVLHLETRMRTEGLDIVAFRAARQGRPISLAVPR